LRQLWNVADADFASQKRATILRCNAADTHIIARKLIPDWQQQAGRKMQPFAFGRRQRFGGLRPPAILKLFAPDRLPVACPKLVGCQIFRAQGPDEFKSFDTLAFVGEKSARKHGKRDAPGPLVLHRTGMNMA